MQIKPQAFSRGQSQPVHEYGNPPPKEQPDAQAASDTGSAEQPSGEARQDVLTLSQESDSKPMSIAEFLEQAKEKVPKISLSDPEDNSAYLTRRLVSSKKQIDLTDVKSQIAKSIASLRMTASMGDKDQSAKARAIIKKLEKLMRRCHRKVQDLNKSDLLKLRQKQAAKNLQQALEQEIKAELERHEKKRKLREQRYLNESRGQLSAAELARIAQQAHVQSAALVNSVGTGVTSELTGVPGSAEGTAAPVPADTGTVPEVASIDVSV